MRLGLRRADRFLKVCDFKECRIRTQLVVSTHLNNISEIGPSPQVGVKIKQIWNHYLGEMWNLFTGNPQWNKHHLVRRIDESLKFSGESENPFRRCILYHFIRNLYRKPSWPGTPVKPRKCRKNNSTDLVPRGLLTSIWWKRGSIFWLLKFPFFSHEWPWPRTPSTQPLSLKSPAVSQRFHFVPTPLAVFALPGDTAWLQHVVRQGCYWRWKASHPNRLDIHQTFPSQDDVLEDLLEIFSITPQNMTGKLKHLDG